MAVKKEALREEKNPHSLIKSEKKSGPGSQVPKGWSQGKSEEDSKVLESPVQLDVPGMKVCGSSE